MWRAEGKWLPKTSRKSVSQSVFCGTSTYCVLNTVPPLEDDHGNSNSSHVKIFLPKKLLECLPKCSSLPKERHRWNTNEEIAAYLITFEKHEEWLTTSPKTRPQNGSMILYNRKKVKYRKDGYCWKKRKDGKTTREDHMKLKVQGVEVKGRKALLFHKCCFLAAMTRDRFGVICCQSPLSKAFLFAKPPFAGFFFLPSYPIASVQVFRKARFN
ncbi:calmodulin-binding transcription activator 1-like isoform X1 [Panthera uncia]|uniref:calmodulin-binding transcription activator 1-like isoform X1 n=1 Tax=Panthera uncia TaxID=29064 RepID=UPI0020FFEC35|nr:calmodulin-binding transcription activator 1-like isoform X1 [Panthera uncia]